jgi:amidase
MNRREFLRLAAWCGMPCLVSTPSFVGIATSPKAFRVRPFIWEEATIADLQAAMISGKKTSITMVKAYLRRIAEIDTAGPTLRSVIELNPDALSIARDLDEERKRRGPRGLLHGIPLLLKDNIDTHDRMSTTAGSLALAGSISAQDSWVAGKLRDAGAVILGKTNLSEWANFRGEHSSSGWSGRGGQTKNPYALDRNPSGSSSGSAAAVSANLCAAAIGTETDGSIISPSSHCGIVGIKPTVGLIGRSGIIPISKTQDTAGPMARCVRDAAILLGALTGMDPRDAATETSAGRHFTDYTQFLDSEGLRGARLGVARQFFQGDERAMKIVKDAIAAMEKRGAAVIELGKEDKLEGFGDAEFEILLYEFKEGLNAYLATLGSAQPVRTLKQLIEFNERHCDKELPHFGQELLIAAEKKGPLTDQAYLDALAKCRRLAATDGIDAIMERHRLDAIVAPAGGPAGKTDWILGDRDAGGSSSPAAVAGYPNITVPAGNVEGLPVGISFFGRAYSEPVLLKIAFAFEQAAKARRVPKFSTTLG